MDARTPKRHASVKDMLAEIGVDETLVESVTESIDSRQLVDQMIVLRHRAGLTQGQMADAMGVSQSAISKLEGNPDSELTLGQISRYMSATKHQMFVSILQEDEKIVGQVKYHALMIKELLDQLVEIANDKADPSICRGINNFWGELLVNLMHIMESSAKKMPNGPTISVTKLEAEAEPKVAIAKTSTKKKLASNA